MWNKRSFVAAMCVAALVPAAALAVNDKIGVTGGVALVQPVPYSIRFENASSATAPTQNLTITDPLDVTTLDPATISLGPIAFGSWHVFPPPGLSFFATTVDLRPTRDLLVHIDVGLDPIGHELSWSFVSLDPATGRPPTDPLAGFLPPNVTPPEGEGSVLFTIYPLNSLANGTTIGNFAAIQFDSASPIFTNTWTNIVDTAPPSSHVLPLPAITAAASIPVSWTADGSPSDLRDFSIFVSEDGSPYRAWRLNTTATFDTLVPPGNHLAHVYAFYSQARDLVGNVEAAPATPDATTQSMLAAMAPPDRLALGISRGNPATSPLRVRLALPTGDAARLELVDVSGRRLWSRDVGALGPGSHEVAVETPLGPGVYFLRLTQGFVMLRARVAALR